ncbi:MAG: DUF1611 domain-containing protein [Candidatus Thermoplasmatota archaeon]|nr:DUF1611 domain-containing protein [Candidatus Thermoplasmatota archaeon]
MEKHRAILYADRLFNCADGKTTHGLVRYSNKYKITCVVDTTLAEGDAGQKLDGIQRGIPLYNDLKRAIELTQADTFIVGAVSEGGILPNSYDKAVEYSLKNGLNIVSGLHEFLSDNPVFSRLAKKNGCSIIDIRKIYRDYKRFYTGEIKKVKSFRVAVLGTDSAIGKRTIAVLLNKELLDRNRKTDMIFTGQTGWLQGWPHGVVLDAMINDFVSGGIEGAILDSWKEDKPEYMIIEGQGSLVHPFFPGGFEILAAGRVDGFILVDAPNRKSLDGFPDYPMPDPRKVIKIAELLTDKPLLGIGINRENMDKDDIEMSIERLSKIFKVPVLEPISMGVREIADVLEDLNG